MIGLPASPWRQEKAMQTPDADPIQLVVGAVLESLGVAFGKREKAYDESKVKRETTAHGDKKPGEFAPKDEAQPAADDTAGQVKAAFEGVAGGIKEASDKKTAKEVAEKGHVAFQRDASAQLFAKDHPDWTHKREDGEHRFYPPKGEVEKPGSDEAKPAPKKPAGAPPKGALHVKDVKELAKLLNITPAEAAQMAGIEPEGDKPHTVEIARQAVESIPEVAPKVAEKLQGNRRATVVLAQPGRWAGSQAAKHAGAVAKHLGIPEATAQKLLASMFQKMAGQVVQNLRAGGKPEVTGRAGAMKFRMRKKPPVQQAKRIPDAPTARPIAQRAPSRAQRIDRQLDAVGDWINRLPGRAVDEMRRRLRGKGLPAMPAAPWRFKEYDPNQPRDEVGKWTKEERQAAKREHRGKLRGQTAERVRGEMETRIRGLSDKPVSRQVASVVRDVTTAFLEQPTRAEAARSLNVKPIRQAIERAQDDFVAKTARNYLDGSNLLDGLSAKAFESIEDSLREALRDAMPGTADVDDIKGLARDVKGGKLSREEVRGELEDFFDRVTSMDLTDDDIPDDHFYLVEGMMETIADEIGDWDEARPRAEQIAREFWESVPRGTGAGQPKVKPAGGLAFGVTKRDGKTAREIFEENLAKRRNKGLPWSLETSALGVATVLKGAKWDPDSHPRDHAGRFVSRGDIAAARHDPELAERLRQRVTQPQERSKLDAAIRAVPTKPTNKRGLQTGTARKEQLTARRGSLHPVARAMQNPGSLTKEELAELPGHLRNLTADQIGRLKKQLELRGGRRVKADMIQRIKDKLFEAQNDAAEARVRSETLPKGEIDREQEERGQEVEAVSQTGQDASRDDVGTDGVSETRGSAIEDEKAEVATKKQGKKNPALGKDPQGGFNGSGGRDEFVRFGDNPPEKVSYDNANDRPEEGVSGFRLEEDGEGLFVRAGNTDMGPLLERPAYLVASYEVGTGGDGEPLFDGHSAKATHRLQLVKDGNKYRVTPIPLDDRDGETETAANTPESQPLSGGRAVTDPEKTVQEYNAVFGRKGQTAVNRARRIAAHIDSLTPEERAAINTDLAARYGGGEATVERHRAIMQGTIDDEKARQERRAAQQRRSASRQSGPLSMPPSPGKLASEPTKPKRTVSKADPADVGRRAMAAVQAALGAVGKGRSDTSAVNAAHQELAALKTADLKRALVEVGAEAAHVEKMNRKQLERSAHEWTVGRVGQRIRAEQ